MGLYVNCLTNQNAQSLIRFELKAYTYTNIHLYDIISI